jgi:FMN phosphatase YigB (HAD superfamily)
VSWLFFLWLGLVTSLAFTSFGDLYLRHFDFASREAANYLFVPLAVLVSYVALKKSVEPRYRPSGAISSSRHHYSQPQIRQIDRLKTHNVFMPRLPRIPKAVIFDVDGTLYDQRKLRFFMAKDLLFCIIQQPNRFTELRIVYHFRRMRKRYASEATCDLENGQYAWPAQAAGVSPEKVREVVMNWMFERPLAYLQSCCYPGAKTLFSQVQQLGIPIGIFSDYPAIDKLKALGLSAQVVVSATCAEVNRLKPDPTGLLVTAKKLDVPVEECLFIGDQEAKDGACARRAGMPYVILPYRNRDRQLHELAVWLRDAKHS